MNAAIHKFIVVKFPMTNRQRSWWPFTNQKQTIEWMETEQIINKRIKPVSNSYDSYMIIFLHMFKVHSS